MAKVKESKFNISVEYIDFILLYHALQEYKPSNCFFTDQQKEKLIKYLETI
jgi:hypothetical protein